MTVKFVGNRTEEDCACSENGNEDHYIFTMDKDDVHTIIDALVKSGEEGMARSFALALGSPPMVFIHQGDLISGSKERHDRRWAAVVLHEEEVRDACKSRGIRFDALDLDNVVKRYTDALLGDGGWYESLKAIVADEVEEGEEEDVDADTDADVDVDTDFGEYAVGNRPCPNCGSNRETRYVPVCDRNPGGLASQTPEEHGNIQEEDGTVLCEDGYCNPREITMKEFRAINGKDAEPQDVITRCHECGTIKG